MIKLILAELGKPDDQGNNWYAWASNQMSHAFLGVMAFGLFGWIGVIVLALAKETFDLIKVRSWLDSAQDVAFWLLGAFVVAASDKVLAVILVVFALLCGVIPRLRKVKAPE